MKRRHTVVASTHLDSQNTRLAKSALKSMAKILNGERKPRLGLEHNPVFPPMGNITDAKLVKGKDGEYYLTAVQQEYDMQGFVKLPNGSVGIKEWFSTENKPFVEIEFDDAEELDISVDYNNFDSYADGLQFIKDIQKAVEGEYSTGEHCRKAAINDPEIIITVSKGIAIYLFGSKVAVKLGEKVLDKLSDKVAEDVAKFYELVKVSAVEGIKRMIPKHRKTTYIVRSTGAVNVELVVQTKNADVVIDALSGDRNLEREKIIGDICDAFAPEKVQLLFNEEKREWAFNYLLTKDGATIGTPKAFNDRRKVYLELESKARTRLSDT